MQKVSVIMPVYNTKEEYLRETIESILNQTYSNFEFIILDDCSTKNVKDVILSYNDNRIKYFRNEKNLGIAETTNKLIELAECELVFMTDHDDISLPKRLEKQVYFMDKNPEIGILGTWSEKFPKHDFIQNPTSNDDILYGILFSGCSIVNSSTVMRKSIVLNNGIKYKSEYDYAQDYEFFTQMIGKTKFANFPEILHKYRWYKSSFSKINRYRQTVMSQKVMFLAQAKYFGVDCCDVINVLDKLLDKEKISVKELKTVLNFASDMKKRAKNMDSEYFWNREAYKLLFRAVKPNFDYLRLLWKNEFIDDLEIRVWFRIENTFKF